MRFGGKYQRNKPLAVYASLVNPEALEDLSSGDSTKSLYSYAFCYWKTLQSGPHNGPECQNLICKRLRNMAKEYALRLELRRFYLLLSTSGQKIRRMAGRDPPVLLLVFNKDLKNNRLTI